MLSAPRIGWRTSQTVQTSQAPAPAASATRGAIGALAHQPRNSSRAGVPTSGASLRATSQVSTAANASAIVLPPRLTSPRPNASSAASAAPNTAVATTRGSPAAPVSVATRKPAPARAATATTNVIWWMTVKPRPGRVRPPCPARADRRGSP